MNPIIGFSPDADRTTPGALVDCEHLIPYEAGFRSAPTALAVNVAALAAECRGAVVATKLDATRRIFAGTQTNLYEVSSATWADVSKAALYTGSAESRWSFCQFGNTTIASNLVDPMQSSATGVFADIAGAPKAKIVVSASNNFVLAFNTNEATYSASQDRWWCCAQNDQTSWTPAASTLANTGRLIAVEGPITAALPLGDYVIAYKQRGIFHGSFVGSPVVWQWNLVPGGEAGCVGQEALCDIGGAHFIVSNDNFWIFDGTRPVAIPTAPRQWFLDNSSPLYRYRTKVSYDRQTNLVRISYPSLASTGACDAGLVYHVLSRKWGRDNMTVEAPLAYIAPGTTIDGMDSYSATIDGISNLSFDSQYWLSGGQNASVFTTAHQLSSLTGATADSSFTTNDFGGDDEETLLDRVRVRFESAPTTATATGYYKANEGDALTTGETSSIDDGKFDLRQSARFHRVKISMTGNHKEYAFNAKVRPAGGR